MSETNSSTRKRTYNRGSAVDRTMSETELLRSVIQLAKLLNWRCAHFRPALTKNGWRTPVSADGAGWPDLVMVRHGRVIFAELKSETGKMSEAQDEWLGVLREIPGAVCAVWLPRDWLNGAIESTLREE